MAIFTLCALHIYVFSARRINDRLSFHTKIGTCVYLTKIRTISYGGFFLNASLYCCKSFVALLVVRFFLLFTAFAVLSSKRRSDILNYSYMSNAGVLLADTRNSSEKPHYFNVYL